MDGLSTIPSGHGYSYLVAKLAKEAAEMLKDVPHVKGVAGFILQIIAIREATEAGREKSHELIDTVLRRSILVLDELLSVGKSPYREKLVRVEGKLKEYQNLLIEILSILQANASKGQFYHRESILNDIDKYHRRIDVQSTELLAQLTNDTTSFYIDITSPLTHTGTGTNAPSPNPRYRPRDTVPMKFASVAALPPPYGVHPSLDPIKSSRTIVSLCTVFDDHRLYRRFLQCSGDDAQVVLDVCQRLLDCCELSSDISNQIITAMQRLSTKTMLFPQCFILRRPIAFLDPDPVGSGSFGDVFKALMDPEVLCLKVLRVNKRVVKRLPKLFAKEAVIWSQLSHSNVLPFYGLYFLGSQMAFVAPWAESSDIGQYLKSTAAHPNRVLLCADTAAGVAYLHSRGVIHGDLKTGNVLVDRSGRAYIADFGLANIDDPDIAHWASQSSVASKGGTARWQAPELHQVECDDGDNSSSRHIIHNTEKTDVYAWGCLVYEIFTGMIPFYHCPSGASAVLQIMMGRTPLIPKSDSAAWTKNGLTQFLWDLMKACWQLNPEERPDMITIMAKLDHEKPDIDPRPPAQWPAGSAVRFRSAQGESSPRSSSTLEGLNAVLERVTRELGSRVSTCL